MLASAATSRSRLPGCCSDSRSTRNTHWSVSRATSWDCSASSRANAVIACSPTNCCTVAYQKSPSSVGTRVGTAPDCAAVSPRLSAWTRTGTASTRSRAASAASVAAGAASRLAPDRTTDNTRPAQLAQPPRELREQLQQEQLSKQPAATARCARPKPAHCQSEFFFPVAASPLLPV